MTSKKFSLTNCAICIDRFVDWGERVLLSPRGDTVCKWVVIFAGGFVLAHIIAAVLRGSFAAVCR